MGTTNSKIITVPLNRVEGDLEIRVEVDDGRVSDAWSAGIMFRGIENMLKGRGARDGLVITPRVCGICGTAHLMAAAKALDAVSGAVPPPNAVRVRNLALMTEHIQSDVRHGILMFMVDFANPAHRDRKLYEEAVRRYEPFKGESVIEAIKATKKAIEIVAILGGQWPHSSYMVPGGVASAPRMSDITQCRYLLDSYVAWYERKVLGCSIDRWQDVRSSDDLDRWLDESSYHRDSDLGFYIRFAREIGLDKYGRGYGNFICYGQLEIPEGSAVRGRSDSNSHLIPSGFARGGEISPFNQEKVAEHVAHSWYEDYEGGRHPFEGETQPYASGSESMKYSWAKAPRYDGQPAETGPLAEMIMSENPLFVDLLEGGGPNAFVRELARLVRPVELMPAMRQWLGELDPDKPYYIPVTDIPDGQGFGLTGATRGALGHWIEIADAKIKHYQIITPTAWNGSPRDSDSVRGPWEEALIGVPVKDPDNPVELGHVIRSFDACLVCTVHGVRGSRRLFRKRV
ncbi:MAG: nickel-dependent hydrogenase large subunit [Proteobacteria bacterium]|nr:nickel-dependent hydrogenase large subunit [Pseudomonadota bacterium]